MLHTRFCELFEIEAPVLQAAIWPATAPELVAEVSKAGGLGSIGAAFASAQELREQIERVTALTDRPFVVNHVVPVLDEDAFEATLEARPAGVSFALGDPGDLADRVHAAGSKVIHGGGDDVVPRVIRTDFVAERRAGRRRPAGRPTG
jgi:enoyl-[acyl-carrier protein] reductase II